jgi:hypothetical protein
VRWAAADPNEKADSLLARLGRTLDNRFLAEP